MKFLARARARARAWPTDISRWPLAIYEFGVKTPGGSYVAKSEQDADWNRSACLVREPAIAAPVTLHAAWHFRKRRWTRAARSISPGSLLDAWYAPVFRGDARTELGSWSKDDLVDFLKYGHNRGGTAFGSMIDVINNSTPYLSDADIAAIATYIKSLPATSTQAARCL